MNALRPISRVACFTGFLGAIGCAGNVTGNGGGPDDGTGGSNAGTGGATTGTGGAGTGTGTTPVPITFRTGSDDGSTLYIDGSLVVNNNNFQGTTFVQSTVNLTPGPHNIDVEFYQGGGGAAMFAQWDPAGGSTFVDIPNSAV